MSSPKRRDEDDEDDDVHDDVRDDRRRSASCATASTQSAWRGWIGGVRVRAPVVPYESQIRVMSQVVRAASRGACALIESPTGSGKSLALLCAALAWREREMEEREESDVERRERACANRLMDMIEKDLRACLPALSMFTRMDQNVDAFEAFLDDMERRFARGTLPKRDVLGDLIVFRWRAFVLVFVATTTATFVGATRMLLRAVM